LETEILSAECLGKMPSAKSAHAVAARAGLQLSHFGYPSLMLKKVRRNVTDPRRIGAANLNI